MTLPRRLTKPAKRSGRWKSPAHLSFVRSHHCVVPGCARLPIEAAHVRLGSDGAMGVKPSDYFAVSLCGGGDGHHAESHRIGEDSFQAKHGINLLALAAEFAAKSPKAREISEAKRERSMTELARLGRAEYTDRALALWSTWCGVDVTTLRQEAERQAA